LCVHFVVAADDIELTERVTITRYFKDKVIQPILKVSYGYFNVFGWRFGLLVMCWSQSMKLQYTGPS